MVRLEGGRGRLPSGAKGLAWVLFGSLLASVRAGGCEERGSRWVLLPVIYTHLPILPCMFLLGLFLDFILSSFFFGF